MDNQQPAADACTESSFHAAVCRVRAGASVDDEARSLLLELTSQERLWLLDGDVDFWEGSAQRNAQGYNVRPLVMGEVPRLGIPGLRFSDGPRGVVTGHSTAFPVSMARGATWDTELEERVGVAIGLELRAQGANLFGGVCVNLPRHPAWGRAQETYGEDPYLLGEFGAALTRGVRHNAMAVVKHFALNSIENARFVVDVIADDATLHETYLPQFRRVVDEGVDVVMTSYNSVNGQWAGQNEVLLDTILRRLWGFRGITMSDFMFGLRDAELSLAAGLDVEAPFRQQRAVHLPTALMNGSLSWDLVDRAGLRILRTQVEYYASDRWDPPEPGVVFCTQHQELALEVARRSIVLLKNDMVDGRRVLPLDPASIGTLAVVGRLADTANTGDHGSSDVRTPHVVTPLQGLSAALGPARIEHVPEDDPVAAAAAARACDVAVVVVGYTAADEGEYVGADVLRSPAIRALLPPPTADTAGAAEEPWAMVTAEGGDRADLHLRPVDVQIIRAVAAANPRTVVVLVTAGAVITEDWRTDVAALLVGWYGGSEGGRALADVLLGVVDATGRLPYSIATRLEHLPAFDRHATRVVYDRWFGQRLLDRRGVQAAFPLGFGLSYTSFRLSRLRVEVDDEQLVAQVDVCNDGPRDGTHVVQLYGLAGAADFPHRVLVGFATVDVPAGQTVRVTVPGSTRPLQRWIGGTLVPACRSVRIEAAAYSGDPDAAAVLVALPGGDGAESGGIGTVGDRATDDGPDASGDRLRHDSA